MSEATGPIMRGDMPVGGWLDRWTPRAVRPYGRLARLDRPIGTWLLLFPCWWSLAMALSHTIHTAGMPDWATAAGLALLFAIGALVMRGAGCTVNDIADRDLDARVARTRHRPIPSGQVSRGQAAVFLGIQLLLGLLVLVQMNTFAIALGAAALVPVAVYPFVKRVSNWPQVWLGLTFNWGALMGWAAWTGGLAPPALVLYAAGILWTLGYDTIYALQDREDDALAGIGSTALALGPHRVRPFVAACYAGALVLIGAAAWLAPMGCAFWLVLPLAALQPVWQVTTLDPADGAGALVRFRSNRWFGWAVLAALVAGVLTVPGPMGAVCPACGG